MASEHDDFSKRKGGQSSNRFDVDFTPLQDFMGKMDSLFNRSFQHLNANLNLNPFWSHTYETETEVIVKAELPGYEKDQIQLEIVGNRLRIAVEDLRTEESEQTTYKGKLSSQKRERVITLPFEIPEKETKASFRNGMLTITIPKKKAPRNYLNIDE